MEQSTHQAMSNSMIRMRVYQLTTLVQTPTCAVARATRPCVYAIGGWLDSPHGTLVVTMAVWFRSVFVVKIDHGNRYPPTIRLQTIIRWRTLTVHTWLEFAQECTQKSINMTPR